MTLLLAPALLVLVVGGPVDSRVARADPPDLDVEGQRAVKEKRLLPRASLRTSDFRPCQARSSRMAPPEGTIAVRGTQVSASMSDQEETAWAF